MALLQARWPLPTSWALLRWRSLLPPTLVLAMGVLLQCFRSWGEARGWAHWDLADILGEGGMVVMSGLWLYLIASGRPPGRVSNWLMLGMAGLALGFWVDFLDEFYRLPKAMLWDNWLESGLTLGGMLTFSRGLLLWREEERALQGRLLKRERLFREHRAYDSVTQLADAGYMACQMALERARRPQASTAVLMLCLPGLAQRQRALGQAESERALQAVSLLLLLNLPTDSLLCRYAGDHFCMLLPGTAASGAEAVAQQLVQAVASLAHHRLDGQVLPLSARTVHLQLPADGGTAAEALLRSLQQRLAAPVV